MKNKLTLRLMRLKGYMVKATKRSYKTFFISYDDEYYEVHNARYDYEKK